MAWYWYATISALTIAAVGLLQKRNLQHEHSTEYVTVFSSIKLLLFLTIFGRSIDWHVTSGQFFLLVLDGGCTALAFYFIAKAMRRLELSTVVPVLALEPGLVAILAAVVLKEFIHSGQVLGIALLVLGTYVLELRRHPDGPGARSTGKLFSPIRRLFTQPGGHYALWGLLFFSLASIIDRFILQAVPTTTFLAYVLTTMTVIFIFRFFLIQERLVVFHREQRPLLWIILAIAGLHLVSNYTQAKATGLAAVGLVIALKRLAVLLDVIIGGKFFHERNLTQKTVASVIMLIGAYFIVAT